MNFATFINATARSASDLLADLQACRQLRHVSDIDKQAIVQFFFGEIENSLLENKRLPGTKGSGPNGGGRYFVWSREAFEEAVSVHGVSCDCCNSIVAVSEDRWRWAADRMLHNLDGEVRLMLCSVCSARFSRFCSRHFQREVRVPWSRDLEQMMLAFLAHELGCEARRALAGTPPRKRNDERSASVKNRTDRNLVESRSDSSGNFAADWSKSKHGGAVSEGLRK